jgi:hypothetical protein
MGMDAYLTAGFGLKDPAWNPESQPEDEEALDWDDEEEEALKLGLTIYRPYQGSDKCVLITESVIHSDWDWGVREVDENHPIAKFALTEEIKLKWIKVIKDGCKKLGYVYKEPKWLDWAEYY